MTELVPGKPAEHWRTRLIRSLLYGRNVDRNVKARARVGFAILAFACVYAVIGGRLVMFAIGANSHSARRAASGAGSAGDSAGAGSKVKIINQLLAGVHIAAAAEAMALGLREGVNPNDLYEVITHSAGNSWMFENRMAHVLAADYTPLSAVDIFVKDLGIVLDVARASKFPLPLSSTAHQMFMQASTAGFAKEDDSAVIKIFPGIELPKGKA